MYREDMDIVEVVINHVYLMMS